MKKKTEQPRPGKAANQTGRVVSITDGKVCTPDKLKGTVVGTQFLAGTEVRIVESNGILYIPEIDVGQGLDQERNNFRHLMERNSELLPGYPYEVMVTSQGQGRKLRLLSFENTRRAIIMVDHNVRDPARREFLIERKRQYFQIIDAYYNQASIPVDLNEAWEEARQKARTNWTRLCHTLKVKVVPMIRDPSHERFVYINEAKMLNKNVYGRHEKGIRDRSTLQQIEALENAEAWDTAFLHLNITEKQKRDMLIDDMLVRHYPDLDLEKALPEPVPTVRISAPRGQRVLIEFMGGI